MLTMATHEETDEWAEDELIPAPQFGECWPHLELITDGDFPKRTCAGAIFRVRSSQGDFAVKQSDTRIMTLIVERTHAAENLQNEALIMQRIPVHPNVVPMVSYYEKDHFVMLLTPLYEQGDLFDYVAEHCPERDAEQFVKFEWRKQVAIIMYEVVKGLAHLHENRIAHLDLSPENIFLRQNGKQALLADFGSARQVKFQPQEKKKMSRFGLLYGKHAYAAPEQFEERCTTFDPFAADAWSLGVLMFVTMTREPPFKKATESCSDFSFYRKPNGGLARLLQRRGLGSSIPAPERAIISALMQVNPSERPTMFELLNTNYFNDVAKALKTGTEIKSL